MKTELLVVLAALVTFVGCSSQPKSSMDGPPSAPGATAPAQSSGGSARRPVPDPLEPVNRVFFQFNDKFYFWLMKPVSSGYAAVVPEPARVRVKNVFSNVTTPVRLVNCLLQADLRGAGTELSRFGINTTVGILGINDPAENRWDIAARKEDTGQTLGVYGLGTGLYINWPILGPSSARGTVGMVGDAFLSPLTYYPTESAARTGIRVGERVNATSLRLGDYEQLKEDALDPYVALRNAYFQRRRHLVKQRQEAK
jgi:phospholipid-binding lipoprotein MlaA